MKIEKIQPDTNNSTNNSSHSSSSSSSTSSRRSNKNDTRGGSHFVSASVINSSTNQCIAVALNKNGTVYTNYLHPKNALRPFLQLRDNSGASGASGGGKNVTTPPTHVLLTECQYNNVCEPVIVMTDDRGIGGALNVLRIAPLKYFTQQLTNSAAIPTPSTASMTSSASSASSASATSTTNSTRPQQHCPLCRSDRDVHWEMSHVPSGCDDDDDLDMMNDSESDDEDDDDDNDNDGAGVDPPNHVNQAAIKSQPPAKRQKTSVGATKKTTVKTTAKGSKNKKATATKGSGGRKNKKRKESEGRKDDEEDEDNDTGEGKEGKPMSGSKMNRKQLEHACKRLEREVGEYKLKMKEVCDSADHRFKEEKRLRKDWNKVQASLQAKACDAEDLVQTLQKKLKRIHS